MFPGESKIYNIAVQVSLSIEVVSGREGTFRVTCTATGRTLFTSSLTGPGLSVGGLQLRAVGSIGKTEHKTYSVTSDTLPRQSDGDKYTCTAMNNLSSPEISRAPEGIISLLHHYKTTFLPYYNVVINTYANKQLPYNQV